MSTKDKMLIKFVLQHHAWSGLYARSSIIADELDVAIEGMSADDISKLWPRCESNENYS